MDVQIKVVRFMEKKMELKTIPYGLSICKLENISEIKLEKEFYFIGKTDEELSLVCRTEDVPERTVDREDGWKGFRIQGTLDFSLMLQSKSSAAAVLSSIIFCMYSSSYA